MSNLDTVGFTDYNAEQQDIERRRKYAEMLQQQSMQPLEQQTAGGWVVPTSWTQGLAKMLQGYSARKGLEQTKTDQEALAGRKRADVGADMQAYAHALRGTPAQPAMTSPGAEIMGNENDVPAQPARDPMDSLQSIVPAMRTPEGQQLAIGGIHQQMAQLAKQNEPYSLAPGATRYGPNGQPIVTAPNKQDGFTLAPGATRYGADGKPIVAAPQAPDKDAGAWSDPYELGGAQVQKNSRTGEIRTAVSRAPVTNVQTSVNAPPPSKIFENEDKLRGDYTTASKAFTGIRDAYNTVNATLGGEITAPATLAAATKFMKMLDPESVVRESELNMALKSTGMLDRFMNLHNLVTKGQVLTPTQVTEIKRIAGALYETSKAQQARTDEYFARLATEYRLNPSRVIRNQGAVTASDRREEPRGGRTVVVDY